jgi:hypothetical protein
MLKDFDGSIFHSMLRKYQRACGGQEKFKQENIEYFNSLNVIDDHSVLAH